MPMSMWKGIRYPTLEDLVKINIAAAKLTGDYVLPYEYDTAYLTRLLDRVKDVSEYGLYDRRIKIVKKIAFLVYWIAEGQHFQEANKRTAMIVGTEFARTNGHFMPLDDAILHKMLAEIAPQHDTYTLNSIEQRVNAVMR